MIPRFSHTHSHSLAGNRRCHCAAAAGTPTTSNSTDMKSHLTPSILRWTAASALLLLATAAHAADASGNWTWSTPGRNGGPERVSTLTLKAEGAKLTGKVSAPGRDGKAVESPIADGKVEGDTIAFSLVREFNGNSTTNKYSGKVSADKITGKIESSRDGQPQSRDWEAKRAADAK